MFNSSLPDAEAERLFVQVIAAVERITKQKLEGGTLVSYSELLQAFRKELAVPASLALPDFTAEATRFPGAHDKRDPTSISLLSQLLPSVTDVVLTRGWNGLF